MCLLVVCSPDSTPKKKDLECASCNNPHGFGYAIITPNGIVTGRGMSSKKIIKEFLEVRKQFPSGYAMFHARYATHGVKNEENCHPFKVGNSTQTYLAHNGILDIDIHATDRRSDTRVFAEDVLPAMGGVQVLDNDNAWKILSKWASGNKIAILTTDPSAQNGCYIINESAGHWDESGMWWSNSTYKPSTYTAYGWHESELWKRDEKASQLDDDNTYSCPSCLSEGYEDANPYYCEQCTTCFECRGLYGDTCQCWSPEWDKQKYASKKESVWYYDKHFDFAK